MSEDNCFEDNCFRAIYISLNVLLSIFLVLFCLALEGEGEDEAPRVSHPTVNLPPPASTEEAVSPPPPATRASVPATREAPRRRARSHQARQRARRQRARRRRLPRSRPRPSRAASPKPLPPALMRAVARAAAGCAVRPASLSARQLVLQRVRGAVLRVRGAGKVKNRCLREHLARRNSLRSLREGATYAVRLAHINGSRS